MIPKLISEFSHLSLVLRIAISTLASTFAGAGFIGFISEYATYYYAISNDVRLPVEGVPYLQMTITLISLALLLSIIMILLVSSLYFYSTGIIFKSVSLQNLPKSFKIILGTITALPFLLLIILILIIIYDSYFVASHHVYLKVVPTTNIDTGVFVPFLITTLTLLLFSSGFYLYPKTKNIFMSLTILLFSALFSLSLFNVDIYNKLLRVTKMGGGYEIIVKTKDEEITGKLFLITRENIMLYNDETNKIKEIPKSNIEEFSYEANINS